MAYSLLWRHSFESDGRICDVGTGQNECRVSNGLSEEMSFSDFFSNHIRSGASKNDFENGMRKALFLYRYLYHT